MKRCYKVCEMTPLTPASAPSDQILFREGRKEPWRYGALACQGAAFGLMEGGFSSGNAHALGRCICSARQSRGANRLVKSLGRGKDRDCATACSLHDARPCGGARALALFQPVGARRARH